MQDFYYKNSFRTKIEIFENSQYQYNIFTTLSLVQPISGLDSERYILDVKYIELFQDSLLYQYPNDWNELTSHPKLIQATD